MSSVQIISIRKENIEIRLFEAFCSHTADHLGSKSNICPIFVEYRSKIPCYDWVIMLLIVCLLGSSCFLVCFRIG